MIRSKYPHRLNLIGINRHSKLTFQPLPFALDGLSQYCSSRKPLKLAAAVGLSTQPGFLTDKRLLDSTEMFLVAPAQNEGVSV